ncbi:DUF2269 domain-containing protein [Alkalihalobacillus sp. MEB130]|uniref:DUF2269 domain-containing protein n=1 Tax=Alkalihalobacillus sp. MEB130 TaxID=2976704 RepID=UPI0028DF3810|nr:DUF2269 domain-containing protein [Alkalihalobacillus sp. MEB130]MDT8861482.1 DUF2269 domain-containing protein [Alkalihalobacillus sp. MEB130]
MTMTPLIRKFMLIVHITSSVSWIGAVACFLALAIVGLTSQDTQIVRAVYLSMDLIVWYIIVPLSLASLFSGLVQSFGTQWGLFRHYWVLVKFLLTILATIVLLLQLEPISYIANVAVDTTFSSADFREVRLSLVVHAAGGLFVLLVIMTLSIYKPRGVTRYGWRKQQEKVKDSK